MQIATFTSTRRPESLVGGKTQEQVEYKNKSNCEYRWEHGYSMARMYR